MIDPIRLLKRISRSLPMAFAVAMLTQMPLKAQTSADAYTAAVSAIADSVIASAAGAAGGDRAATYFALQGRDPSLGESDAVISGARRLYEIYLALGGPQLDRHGYYERKDGRIYIGLDGDGGRWVDGGAQALEVFREQLVEQALAQQSATSAGAAPCSSFSCLLSAHYKGQVPLAGFAPRGETQVLTLSGEGFNDANGPPVVLTPASLYVGEVAFDGDGALQVSLSVDEAAALGAKELHVFNRGSSFRSVGAYLVHVVASVAELEVIAAGGAMPKTTAPAPNITSHLGGVGSEDDHGDEAAIAAEIADSLDGRLERPGDRDVFRLVVPQSAAVQVASSGAADLGVELRNAASELIATDDDSGAGYNFQLSQTLSAGTYFITVSHCCGGTGSYQLTVSQTPQ